LLDQNQISELIVVSIGNEILCDVVAMKDEEYCEEDLLEPYLRSKSGYLVCSSTQAPSSPDSASISAEADGVQCERDPQTQQPPNSREHFPLTFTGAKREE